MLQSYTSSGQTISILDDLIRENELNLQLCIMK
jgi:hypothetical protein